MKIMINIGSFNSDERVMVSVQDEEMIEIGVQIDGGMGTIELPIHQTSALYRLVD
jgi:hypothetical protein